MGMIKKILTATDFSDLSANGVRYACRLARDLGAEMIIVNAVKMDETGAFDKQQVERHKRRLDDFLTDLAPDVGSDLKIRKIVDMGDPYGTILDWAKDEQVSLIVMSTHGRSGLPRMLLGSVTERLLRSSPCPVLAIPPQEQ